jgi:hypothetical protein
MTERVLVLSAAPLSAAPLSAAAASALPQNLQSMGQANLLQATESMSSPLVAPAWVGIDRQRVLVPMVPQVLVQVVQQGPPGVNIAVNVQQNLLQGLIWVFPSIEDTPLVNFTSRRKGELWGFDTRTSEQTDLRESEAITFRYSVWRSPSVI